MLCFIDTETYSVFFDFWPESKTLPKRSLFIFRRKRHGMENGHDEGEQRKNGVFPRSIKGKVASF